MYVKLYWAKVRAKIKVLCFIFNNSASHLQRNLNVSLNAFLPQPQLQQQPQQQQLQQQQLQQQQLQQQQPKSKLTSTGWLSLTIRF